MTTNQHASDQDAFDDPNNPQLDPWSYQISTPSTDPEVPYNFLENVILENGSKLILTSEYESATHFSVTDAGTRYEFDEDTYHYLGIVRGPADVPPFPLQLLEAGTPNMVLVFLIPADGVQSIIDPNTGYELVASAGSDGSVFFAPAAKPEDALEWRFSGPNDTPHQLR